MVIARSAVNTKVATTTWNAPANTGCSSAVAPHGGSTPPWAACAIGVNAVVSAFLSGSSKDCALATAPRYSTWRKKPVALTAHYLDGFHERIFVISKPGNPLIFVEPGSSTQRKPGFLTWELPIDSWWRLRRRPLRATPKIQILRENSLSRKGVPLSK